MILTVLFLLSAAVFLYLWNLERQHHKNYGRIPGPKGLPFVGNFFDLNQKDENGKILPMQTVLDRWRYQFGSPFKFRIGPLTYVVFGTYDTIMEAMVKKSRDFAGKPYQYRLDLTGDTHSLGGMTYTPLCKVLRKLCLRRINSYAASGQNFEEKVTEAFHHRFDTITEAKGSKIRLFDVLVDEITNVLYILLFGKPASHKGMAVKTMKDLNEAFAVGLQSSFGALLLDLFPVARIFPNKIYDACILFRKINDAFWGKQIEDRRVTWDGEEENCFMESMLKEQRIRKQQNDEIQLDEDNLIAMSSIMYNAGLTTLSSAMNSVFLMMTREDSIQKRVLDEITSAFGTTGTITMKRCKELHYTRAIIFETLRFATPVPIPIPRATMCDTAVAGYKIPAGTPVMVNVHGVHHDPEVWPDPYSFRPERFLDTDGQLVAPDSPVRRRILSFGAGDRSCVGEQLALDKMLLFIALLTQRFQLKAPPGDVLPSSDPRDFVHGLVEAADGYDVLLVPR